MRDLKRKTTSLLSFGAAFMLLGSMTMMGCDKEEVFRDGDARKASIYVTDAPLDNAEVEAVFVTIAGLEIDGERVDGFQKTTVELSALTEGRTELLEDVELEASTISEVKFILDYEQDDQGNSPGSFVLHVDGEKDRISSTSNEIVVQADFFLDASSNNEFVFDFDLRKMLREESDNNYELVTSGEIETSIRALVKSETGNVMGEVETTMQSSGTFVAYLYAKGQYADDEMQGSGESGIQFSNAINSTVLPDSGSFTIAFVEEGEYEIVVFEYEDMDKDGSLELKGKAEVDLLGEISLGGIDISAASNTEIDLKLTGLLPL